MSNLARELIRPTEADIKRAEENLIAKLAEAEKYRDDECENFDVVAARIREKLINGKL